MMKLQGNGEFNHLTIILTPLLCVDSNFCLISGVPSPTCKNLNFSRVGVGFLALIL